MNHAQFNTSIIHENAYCHYVAQDTFSVWADFTTTFLLPYCSANACPNRAQRDIDHSVYLLPAAYVQAQLYSP